MVDISHVVTLIRTGVLNELRLAKGVYLMLHQVREISVRLRSSIEAMKAVTLTLPAVHNRLEELEAFQHQLDELFNGIQKTNLTPISDLLVQEVKDNDQIETPDVVATAPTPSDAIVQEHTVVESALNALVAATGHETVKSPDNL